MVMVGWLMTPIVYHQTRMVKGPHTASKQHGAGVALRAAAHRGATCEAGQTCMLRRRRRRRLICRRRHALVALHRLAGALQALEYGRLHCGAHLVCMRRHRFASRHRCYATTLGA